MFADIYLRESEKSGSFWITESMFFSLLLWADIFWGILCYIKRRTTWTIRISSINNHHINSRSINNQLISSHRLRCRIRKNLCGFLIQHIQVTWYVACSKYFLFLVYMDLYHLFWRYQLTAHGSRIDMKLMRRRVNYSAIELPEHLICGAYAP